MIDTKALVFMFRGGKYFFLTGIRRNTSLRPFLPFLHHHLLQRDQRRPPLQKTKRRMPVKMKYLINFSEWHKLSDLNLLPCSLLCVSQPVNDPPAPAAAPVAASVTGVGPDPVADPVTDSQLICRKNLELRKELVERDTKVVELEEENGFLKEQLKIFKADKKLLEEAIDKAKLAIWCQK
uniref:Uncharacterized protein n=1 Tax=Paramoeba aestuarina TaxID=180227 RepID=A0A7S4KXE4_9EUKA